MFSLCNFIYSDLSVLGLEGIYYSSLGGFGFSAGYFIVYYKKFDYKNHDLYSSTTGKRRNVWTNADGKIAWNCIGSYIIAACF